MTHAPSTERPAYGGGSHVGRSCILMLAAVERQDENGGGGPALAACLRLSACSACLARLARTAQAYIMGIIYKVTKTP